MKARVYPGKGPKISGFRKFLTNRITPSARKFRFSKLGRSSAAVLLATAVGEIWAGGWVWAAGGAGSGGVPSPIGNNSMSAASPMTDYTVAAVIYVLIIGVLVAGLLIGGLLIVNLGLMSKRQKDHTGGRTPSDVGILKNSNWPQEPESTSVLPADEDEEESNEPGEGGGRVA